MDKVVVTGGAGFIGSHLAEALAGEGYRVTIVDDLSGGRLVNIAGLAANPDVEFVRGSVTDMHLLKQALRGARYCFHLAAIPSVPRSIADPLPSLEVNIGGTLNVLLAARDNGVARVVFASSSSVYGDTPTLPKREAMTPRPLSPYAVTKLTGEHYCRVFNDTYHLPTVCLRYFNVFGPRQDPDSPYAAVIPRFVKNITEGRPPVIYGDGEQTRDFTFVKDVVRANLLAAAADISGVINVSRGEAVTINRLAATILQEMGSDLRPEYRPARPGDIRDSLADISRAKGIGYRPGESFEAGLRETLDWYRAGSYAASGRPATSRR
jgi:UDP-glucose 4-epimerase